MTLITGNTFPVKEQIKALGGKWNPTAKGWNVPDDKAEEAQALVANAPKSKTRSDNFANAVAAATSNGRIDVRQLRDSLGAGRARRGRRCYDCKGTGYLRGQPCDSCDGEGFEE